MIYALIAFAVVSVAAMGLSLHIAFAYNGFVKTVENWTQSLSDDCNRNLNSFYSVLVAAMKEDVVNALEEINKENKTGKDVEEIDSLPCGDVEHSLEEEV